MSDENSEKETQPPTTYDEKALAFAAQIGEYDRRRSHRGQKSSGMLRILALADADLRGE